VTTSPSSASGRRLARGCRVELPDAELHRFRQTRNEGVLGHRGEFEAARSGAGVVGCGVQGRQQQSSAGDGDRDHPAIASTPHQFEVSIPHYRRCPAAIRRDLTQEQGDHENGEYRGDLEQPPPDIVPRSSVYPIAYASARGSPEPRRARQG
jgi:hypothetical protein